MTRTDPITAEERRAYLNNCGYYSRMPARFLNEENRVDHIKIEDAYEAALLAAEMKIAALEKVKETDHRALLKRAADVLEFWAESATGEDKQETENLITRIGAALQGRRPMTAAMDRSKSSALAKVRASRRSGHLDALRIIIELMDEQDGFDERKPLMDACDAIRCLATRMQEA